MTATATSPYYNDGCTAVKCPAHATGTDVPSGCACDAGVPTIVMHKRIITDCLWLILLLLLLFFCCEIHLICILICIYIYICFFPGPPLYSCRDAKIVLFLWDSFWSTLPKFGNWFTWKWHFSGGIEKIPNLGNPWFLASIRSTWGVLVGVSKNRDTPNWMVKIMEKPIF